MNCAIDEMLKAHPEIEFICLICVGVSGTDRSEYHMINSNGEPYKVGMLNHEASYVSPYMTGLDKLNFNAWLGENEDEAVAYKNLRVGDIAVNSEVSDDKLLIKCLFGTLCIKCMLPPIGRFEDLEVGMNPDGEVWPFDIIDDELYNIILERREMEG